MSKIAYVNLFIYFFFWGVGGVFSFSWVALQEEMRLDMQRIWKRNMGRDDRCISDHGKEVVLISSNDYRTLIICILTYLFYVAGKISFS